MKKQYAIIYWPTKGRYFGPYPHTILDSQLAPQLKTYETLEEADKAADHLEGDGFGVECRVISIDSVHE